MQPESALRRVADGEQLARRQGKPAARRLIRAVLRITERHDGVVAVVAAEHEDADQRFVILSAGGAGNRQAPKRGQHAEARAHLHKSAA